LDKVRNHRRLLAAVSVGGGNLAKKPGQALRREIERLTQDEENLIAAESPAGLVSSLVAKLKRSGVPSR